MNTDIEFDAVDRAVMAGAFRTLKNPRILGWSETGHHFINTLRTAYDPVFIGVRTPLLCAVFTHKDTMADLDKHACRAV